MTPREKMIMALEGKQPPGRVPHFELVFFLTMEAFGRVHPTSRVYGQWDQMSDKERDLHRRDIADLYVQTSRRYEQSAIFYHPPGGWKSDEESIRVLEHVRELSGQEFLTIMHGDTTFSLPDGNHMMEFVERLAEEPQKMKDEQEKEVDRQLADAARWKKRGVLDAYALCADYCFNNGPFLSPAMFDEFVTPFLARLTAGMRELGYYVIKHTDGNIMPILDSLVETKPHALHSIDPQGHVDIAEVKRLVGDKVCLIGNVSCGLLQTGTEEQVRESVRYALKHGMPGGGYIFSTSNCVYTGLPLERYDLMLDEWRKLGNYQ